MSATQKTILLAEDEEGIRIVLEAVFGRDKRYRLLYARDGEEALAIAQKELPDLLVTDIVLPRRDGKNLCRALKSTQATSHIKVLLLSALDSDAGDAAAIASGADGFVAKPFSPRALQGRVANLLGIS
jgi:DNA-binding response OmpR family regulator